MSTTSGKRTVAALAHPVRGLSFVLPLPVDGKIQVVTIDGRVQIAEEIAEAKYRNNEIVIRNFENIAAIFSGTRARIEKEIIRLEKRDINVAAYRDALNAAIIATQPFAGEMVNPSYQAMDNDVSLAIDNALLKLDELETSIGVELSKL